MSSGDVTLLLQRAGSGDAEALSSVYHVLYQELQQIARAQLNRYGSQTLNTVGLINESFLKLVEQERVALENRSHFLAVSSRAMRHILVDYFRKRRAEKRGGPNPNVTLVEDAVAGSARDDDVLALDEALSRLQDQNERLAQVVECKFFGGMTYEEIAAGLGLSARTVRQDWKKAKAWLTLEMS